MAWQRNSLQMLAVTCSSCCSASAAGDRQMSLDIMRKLMQARVDPRFKDATWPQGRGSKEVHILCSRPGSDSGLQGSFRPIW